MPDNLPASQEPQGTPGTDPQGSAGADDQVHGEQPCTALYRRVAACGRARRPVPTGMCLKGHGWGLRCRYLAPARLTLFCSHTL